MMSQSKTSLFPIALIYREVYQNSGWQIVLGPMTRKAGLLPVVMTVGKTMF